VRIEEDGVIVSIPAITRRVHKKNTAIESKRNTESLGIFKDSRKQLHKSFSPSSPKHVHLIMNKSILRLGLLLTLSMASYSHGMAQDTADNDKVFAIVDEMPSFPEGNDELFNFIRKNIKYPQDLVNSGLSGKVIIQFVVTKEGKIKDPKVFSSFSPIATKEAMRIMDMMPTWKPGKHRGVPVNVSFIIPFTFALTK
jgi:hypothetical protein